MSTPAGEIAILGICLFQHPGLLFQLYLMDTFSQLTQAIRELLKRSARSQVLFIFHDSSCNELPINFWIHIFWILYLLYKINRQPIHYVTHINPAASYGFQYYTLVKFI